MGDRVLIQCFSSKTGEVGPVIYGHWSGYDSADAVRRLAERMKPRQGDVAYSSARMVQELIGADDKECHGFGIWNEDKKLTKEDSHGDAGIILIDVDNEHRCECLGGYLTIGDDGLPNRK